jgi:hypothetical protein
MFCNNCGKEILLESKFCNYCGTKIETSIIEKAKSTSNSKEAFNIEVSNKFQKAIQKILISILLGVIIGLISYPISNAILEVDKKDLSPEDFNFFLKAGADNAALRRQDLMDQSLHNSIIVGIVAVFVIIGFKFIMLEKKQENNLNLVDSAKSNLEDNPSKEESYDYNNISNKIKELNKAKSFWKGEHTILTIEFCDGKEGNVYCYNNEEYSIVSSPGDIQIYYKSKESAIAGLHYYLATKKISNRDRAT